MDSTLDSLLEILFMSTLSRLIIAIVQLSRTSSGASMYFESLSERKYKKQTAVCHVHKV